MASIFSLLFLLFTLSGSFTLPQPESLSLSPNPDQVTSLPGVNFPLAYRHYSGYLESINASQLHYWFFESARNPSTDPLVLWLNGGPGCSSLLGALTENGPLSVNQDGTISPNAFAWNNQTNVLYLESPAGVGFSYNPDGGPYTTDDRQTAKLNFQALKSFFTKYPNYIQNDFYIAGESYGGVYVPTLSEIVLDRNLVPNFKGFIVGNGYLDQALLGNSYLHFVYYHGLIDTPVWEEAVEKCCKRGEKLRKCDFVGSQKAECQLMVQKIYTQIAAAPINEYNIYATCNQTQRPQQAYLTPETVSRRFLATHLLNLPQSYLSTLTDSPPCLNYDALVAYLARKDVRTSLHIRPQSLSWTPCSSSLNYTNTYKTLLPVVRKLLGAGLKGLVYNGDVDTACNFLGDQWFIEELGLKGMLPYQPWIVQETGQVGGFVKMGDNFAYTTIRGSGHMVPEDKPRAALQMFNQFINQK